MLTLNQRRLTLWFTTTAVVVPVIAASSSSSSSYRNVYGNPLQACSSSGMALTGYTRTGYCVDRNDDAGSHHICIDLSTSSSTDENFCQVTGQSNWCDSTDMPCHNNSNKDDASASSSSCAIQNWCVCQWAFATYIETAGGCNAIQDIVCDAVNEQAALAYDSAAAASQGGKYQQALDCIIHRCGLDASVFTSTTTSKSTTTATNQSIWQTHSNHGLNPVVVGIGTILVAALLLLVHHYWRSKNKAPSLKQQLM